MVVYSSLFRSRIGRLFRKHGSPSSKRGVWARCATEPLEGRTLLAGSGLAGAYFARTNLTLSRFARVDAGINFQWSGGTPASSLGTDGFSVRWMGRVIPKFSETYTFITRTSGGVRLWVNGKPVIDDWRQHDQLEDRGAISLGAGQRYDIRMDYWSDGSSPVATLEWQSRRLPRQVVPANRLYAATLDSSSPTAPTQLRAASATDTSVRLVWRPSTDPAGIAAYDVYVGPSKVGSTPPGVTSFTRTGLSASTGYKFSVQAVDPAGHVSKTTSTAITTAASSNRPPTAPGNLSVTGVTSRSISLSWSASNDDQGVAGYRIYRNGVKLGASPTGTSFTDTGLSPGTAYSYTVRAADVTGLFSGSSNTASGTTSAVGSHDALAGFTASSHDDSSGATDSGTDLVNLNDGSWARYDNVNFGSGGVNSVKLALALPSSNRGGWIELHIDDVNGTQIGSLGVQPTGSWSTYFTQQVNITGVSGTHDLYVVFRGRNGVANFRSIQFSTAHLTRIMALGDSITQQNSNAPSYRYYLWHDLMNAGLTNVDFVGGQTQAWEADGSLGDPPNFDFDQNHEGHAGWTAGQIADNVGAWAGANTPDIVLLHAGTNDIRSGLGVQSALNSLGRIIDNLRGVNPNVKILLAQLIPDAGFDDQINQLNAAIPGLAQSKSTGQSPVIVVDQHSGISESADMQDGIHLNASGDAKMAQQWYNALSGLLG